MFVVCKPSVSLNEPRLAGIKQNSHTKSTNKYTTPRGRKASGLFLCTAKPQRLESSALCGVRFPFIFTRENEPKPTALQKLPLRSDFCRARSPCIRNLAFALQKLLSRNFLYRPPKAVMAKKLYFLPTFSSPKSGKPDGKRTAYARDGQTLIVA